MGTVISFPAERRLLAPPLAESHDDIGSVIILPVVRVERHAETPSDSFGPNTSTPRGKRRKR